MLENPAPNALNPDADPLGEPSGDTSQLHQIIDQLTSRPEQGHGPDGKFLPGNTSNVSTLKNSEAFWTAVEPLQMEIIERVARDLALDSHGAFTMFRTLDLYAQMTLLREGAWHQLIQRGGPVTNKGAARALLRVYLIAADRELKLAQVLGLERRTKRIDPIDAIRAAVVEANKT